MKKLLLLFSIILVTFTIKAQNIQWAKNLSGNYFQSDAIAYDHNGNVYVAGNFVDSMKFGATTYYTPLNTPYFYFVKYDTAGAELWHTVVPNIYEWYGTINDLACDNNGNVYFIGSTGDSSLTFGAFTFTGNGTVYGKINNAGVFQWVKAPSDGFSAGGNISLDAAGNIYITGDLSPDKFNGTFIELDGTVSTTDGSVYVAKLDNAGNAQWIKSGGYTGQATCHGGVTVDESGYVYMTGFYADAAIFDGFILYTQAPPGMQNDIFLAKYDPAGNFIWAKRAAGGLSDKHSRDLTIDNDNNIYMTGDFRGTVTFAPLAPIAYSGGGAYMADMFVAKFDTAGVAKWVKKGGSSGSDDQGYALTVLNNQIVATGYMSGNSSFGGIPLLIANGATVVVKYDNLGNILWALNAGSGASAYANPISITNDEATGIYVAGFYGGAATTFGTTILPAPSGTASFPFTFKIADCPTISLSPATSNLNICASTSTTLSAPAGFSPYLWSTGATTQTISVSAPGIYSADVTYPGGCKASSNQINVANFQAPPPPSICLVTVDIASTHNILDWSKDTLATNIDSFRIYREVTTNVYAQIGAVSFDSLSEFHDYGADPNVTSYKYKISILDSCGNETAQSLYHNTIHLQNLGGGNLQWTLYGIESSANPVVFYRVLRDDLGTNNFLPISSTIPGGNSTYTDVNYASFPNADYRVDVTWNISCTPLRATINTTRSNIKHQNSIVSGLSFSELNSAVSMYPNPANTFVTIVLSEDVQKANVEILNVLGEVIYKDKISTTTGTSSVKQIDISRYAKGIYSVTIESNGTKVFKKLVVN